MCLRWCKVWREKTNIPLVFLTYANPIFAYGARRFIQNAADVGLDGFIVPDIPFEERDELAPLCEEHGLSPHPVDCTHLERAHWQNRAGGGRLCILRIVDGRDGRAKKYRDGYRFHGAPGKRRCATSPAPLGLASTHRNRPRTWRALPTGPLWAAR